MTAAAELPPEIAAPLGRGVVIPAHPLALTSDRHLDEAAQRALTRYYAAAGAGGVAVGVHTTQFGIRAAGLLAPVLELAAETLAEHEAGTDSRLLRVAGIIGPTPQAVEEAALARDLGYDLGLLSLAALPDADDDELIEHARAVGELIPLFGFYLQTTVGGRELSRPFWRRFASLPSVAAIKIAPFDRYRTLEVIHGVAESGRAAEIALYTGNDDHIVEDLAGEFPVPAPEGLLRLRMVGGLLGHWAVWTRRAVELFEHVRSGAGAPQDLALLAAQVTEANRALFDVAHGFRGCIAGIQEVLHRQGLLRSPLCLDPDEGLSPGQRDEIERVRAVYPHLIDDEFVAEHLDQWLR